MKLEPAADRESFREHPAVLLLETIPERRGEDFARLVADQRPLAGDLAAKDERFIDRDISRVLVLDEEDDVADAIEKLNSREWASEGGGEFQCRVSRSDGGRGLFANFQAAACFCIKKERPRHAKVTRPETSNLVSPDMRSQVFSGTMPALMTPCGADRRPDFDALVRTGRQLVDAGMSALVYCGSMGDWPLLTLEQRMQGVERLVDAGLPVIVGTGAQNTGQAAELARHAKTCGAARADDHSARSVARLVRSRPTQPFRQRPGCCGRSCLRSSTTARTMASRLARSCSSTCAASSRISSDSRNSAARSR